MTPNAAGGPSAPPGFRPAGPPDGAFDPSLGDRDYYWYTTNPGSLAAGATGNSSIQIDAGTDFFWIATSLQSDLAGAAQTDSSRVLPLLTLLINDSGSTKNLMNTPTPVGSLAGSAEFPYRLIRPRRFTANSVITFTWVNYSAGTTYSNSYLTLHGYRRKLTSTAAPQG